MNNFFAPLCVCKFSKQTSFSDVYVQTVCWIIPMHNFLRNSFISRAVWIFKLFLNGYVGCATYFSFPIGETWLIGSAMNNHNI